MSNSITVLGIFVADLCFKGKNIPRVGETQIGDNFQINPGGKGSNQAITIAKLEGDVNFITTIGEDEYGKMAQEIWSAEEIEGHQESSGASIQNHHQECQISLSRAATQECLETAPKAKSSSEF